MRISDWSSDVCSSDLDQRHHLGFVGGLAGDVADRQAGREHATLAGRHDEIAGLHLLVADEMPEHRTVVVDADQNRVPTLVADHHGDKSEERRVGKEWVSTVRSRWPP